MKKVFKTLSAILLATACLAPGLAWADAEPSVALNDSGALKAENASAVHSALVELEFIGGNADKVTDVYVKNAPDNAMGSAVYDATTKKATIAVSSGADALKLINASYGTVNVVAQGASVDNPVAVQAKLTSFVYIDSADSSSPTEDGVFSTAAMNLMSTESTSPTPSEGDGMGYGIEGSGRDAGDLVNTNTNGTTTANYKANGAISPTQAGQSGGSAGLVKTGDVLAICAIALGVAAVAVVIAMLVSRKKGSARK